MELSLLVLEQAESARPARAMTQNRGINIRCFFM
jgi:hypothetical protein